MQRVLESHVEQTVVNKAKNAGWYVRKVRWIGVDGAPDRLFAKLGRLVFIEFKRPGGRLSGRQPIEHREMRAAGIELHVCESIEEALEVLEL